MADLNIIDLQDLLCLAQKISINACMLILNFIVENQPIFTWAIFLFKHIRSEAVWIAKAITSNAKPIF